MDRQQYIATLQKELKNLEDRHAKLEVTVKVWNTEKRELQTLIDKTEDEMLDLRIKAWREYCEYEKQLKLF